MKSIHLAWFAAVGLGAASQTADTLNAAPADWSETRSEPAAREEAPPPREVNGCSTKCPTYDETYSKMSRIPACLALASSNQPSSALLAKCAGALACYLGKKPTKMQILDAIGLFNNEQGFGPAKHIKIIKCLGDSDSSQNITPPTITPDGVTVNMMRCIAGLNLDDAVWFSFTTDMDDLSIEAADIKDSRSGICGTRPLGVDFETICQTIDSLKAFDDLTSELQAKAIGTSPEFANGECSICHTKLAGSTSNQSQCFFFPMRANTPLCPNRPYAPYCEKDPRATKTEVGLGAAKPACKNGKAPICDGKNGLVTPFPEPACADGSTPACPDTFGTAKCGYKIPAVPAGKKGLTADFCTGLAQQIESLDSDIKESEDSHEMPTTTLIADDTRALSESFEGTDVATEESEDLEKKRVQLVALKELAEIKCRTDR